MTDHSTSRGLAGIVAAESALSLVSNSLWYSSLDTMSLTSRPKSEAKSPEYVLDMI